MVTTNPGGAAIAPRHAAIPRDSTPKAPPAGLYKIDEQVLEVPSPTIDFPSIPQDFKILKVFASLRCDTAAAFAAALYSVNNDVDDTHYFREELRATAAGVVGAEFLGAAGSRTVALMPAANAPAGHFALVEFTLVDYARGDKIKAASVLAASTFGITTGLVQARQTTILRNNVAAIDRFAINANVGNFVVGSSVSVYGVESSFG